MSKAFTFTETDSGTKQTCITALRRTARKLDKNFIEMAHKYWMAVYETAKRLCLEMGAFDTGTLYNSIRLLWVYEPSGGMFEVAVSSAGVDMVAMIKVGGGTFINPKTGRVCDYAQAVHDGTRYMAERPFLTMAIFECEHILQVLQRQSVDSALTEFVRDY